MSILVKTGTLQDVQAAIKNGADVNAKDEYSTTVLGVAADKNKNPEVTTTLLKAGADIKAQDNDGTTVLMHAAEYNTNPEVVATLLKTGANAKVKDKRESQSSISQSTKKR